MRSWTMMRKANMPDLWRNDNLGEHYLVIIDNLVSLPRPSIESDRIG